MVTITQFSYEQLEHEIKAFIDMLKLAVDSGASIGWLPPISREDARLYWLDVQIQVEQGNKILIVAQQDNKVVGTVQLGLEQRENGNHRAEVQKLLVHLNYRRQGIAYQLMQALDQAARDANRTLLFLDVREGDIAEKLYQKIGYVRVGAIPQYAKRNQTEIDATVIYYKLLD